MLCVALHPAACIKLGLHVRQVKHCVHGPLTLYTCLASACAEEEKRQRSKFKLPKAFQRAPNPRQQQGQQSQGEGLEGDLNSPTSSDASAAAAVATAAPASGSGSLDPRFDPVGALQDFYGPGSPASPSLSASLGLAADAEGLTAAARGQRGAAGAAAAGGGAELLSQADLVDYPYLIDGDPTAASYLLLCCADYLRIYSTGGCGAC